LRHTNVVLVLDRGRLADIGNHQDLVARPGVYRDTWLAQRQGATGEASGVAS
jgi:ABC-type multidrug transport system fused ATPase/permease subunit